MWSDQDLNQLYRFALALSQDESLAYDLVHSALLRTVSRTVKNPKAYIRSVIRNLFYDEMRIQQREPLFDEPRQDTVVDLNMDLEKMAIRKEELENLLKEIEPLDREILYLWGVEEFNYSEISEELQIKRGTLLSRISRLRARLSAKEVAHEKTT